MGSGTGQQLATVAQTSIRRVDYRTNLCRRRFASDLARASERIPAQGALEDHHDRLSGSPLHEFEHLPSALDLQTFDANPPISSRTGALDV
jgi:hypothetical protein